MPNFDGEGHTPIQSNLDYHESGNEDRRLFGLCNRPEKGKGNCCLSGAAKQ